MNKFRNILVLLVIALMVLSLTGCNDEDNLDTNQYVGDVSLESFGPCPVLRGGTLHFYGKNLEQITEIDLPEADPITQIEVVKSGTQSEITIQVPKEKCGPGQVTLKTATGKEITSVTPVTYREDIVISDFYVGDDENNKIGSVGDVVTFKGDYLNLFHGVIFTDKDTIKEDQFIKHDRYTIQVAIPVEAKTGKIKLTDLAATPVEMETEDILTVNLPNAASIDNANPKAGQTITITGESLSQIAGVKFTGVANAITDFTVSADGKSLSVVVPIMATDGEVTLVTKSGVDIPAGTITTVVPSNLSAAPSPVKNGNDLTISGKDLDLVTGVSFANDDTVRTLKSQTATQIVVKVSEKAQDGDAVLHLANGKTVTVAITLVKPVVTSATPNSVVAGKQVMFRGTDLDLVESVSFPGDVTLTADAAKTRITASAIGTVVPEAAYGAGATLNLKNGTKVEVPASLITIVAATTPAVNGDASGVQGTYVTVTGKNFNNVEAVYIGTTKVTKFQSKSNDSMTFQVPASIAGGTYDFIMTSPDGTRTVVGKFTVKSPEIDIAKDFGVTNMDGSAITYPYSFTWSDNGRFRINKADLNRIGVKKGSKLIIRKNAGATGQVQINDANWGSIYTIADWTGSETELVQVFDDKMMAGLTTTDGWSDTAFILQGALTGVTGITILP